MSAAAQLSDAPSSNTDGKSTAEILFQIFQPRSNPRFHGGTIDGEKDEERSKLKGDTATKDGPLTLDLFRQHVRGKVRLGAAPLLDDGTVLFGVIDVDPKKYTEFAKEIPGILARVKQVDPDFIPVLSRSGGLHLYMFCLPAGAGSLRTFLEAIRRELGLDPKTEIFPRSEQPDPAACPGGWVHLPYCGASGYALNWDNTAMSAQEFADAIDGHRKDEAALRATRMQQALPKKSYEEGFEPGNTFNFTKSRIALHVQQNPAITVEDLTAWARKEFEGKIDDTYWHKWNVPKLCIKILAAEQARKELTFNQRRNATKLINFAINLIKQNQKTDQEIEDAVRARNSDDPAMLPDACIEWVMRAAVNQVAEHGAAAGAKKVKPQPTYLAEQAIRQRYDLARDSAYQPHYYDRERHKWHLDLELFNVVLREFVNAEGRIITPYDSVNLQYALAHSDGIKVFYDKPPRDRINLKNGILNLKTLELVLHSKIIDGKLEELSIDFLWPNQFDIAWDPKARCPKTETMLNTILGEAEAVVFFELLGYLLVPDTDNQKAFFFQGPGGNGKSTLIEVIRFILGEENCSSITFQDMEGNRFSLINLVGKLVNIDSDVTTKTIPGSQTFLKITSGIDRFTVEQKYHQPVDGVKIYSRLLFSCNPFPRCNNNSDAFWSRCSVLRFLKKSFRKGQKDHKEEVKATELIASLKQEAPGILRRAVLAYKAMQEREGHDFTETALTKQWLQDFKLATDSLSLWLNQKTTIREGAIVKQALLHAGYTKWCGNQDIAPMSAQDFSAKVQELRPGVTSDVNPHHDAIFIGLGPMLENDLTWC